MHPKLLHPLKVNYSSIEHELLGVLFSVLHFKTFHIWMQGSHNNGSQTFSISLQKEFDLSFT